MALIPAQPVSEPATQYDRIHLDSLTITCARTQEAPASFNITIVPYYINHNGVKIFSNTSITKYIDNAYQFADMMAASGDTSIQDANEQLKSIVALFISHLNIAGTITKV